MSHVHFSDLKQLKYLTQIDLWCKNGDCTWRECLTVKNQWGLLTGDDGDAPAKSISV